ncbi:hypothetical protein [Streptomyces sp. WZ-12]|uniref:hypothetical protein n=1 Tax=Streptomyces sp. WZ-12 TaxID=3030210 RepID=UPI00238115C1|nr:hypothetical protein [Streptomyces sp. WZ-12]
MVSGKKFAVIAALLGGLAGTCAVGPQAYAADGSGCTRGDADGRTCVHKKEASFTTKDGKHVIVRQYQRCHTSSRHRVVFPESGLLGGRKFTEAGPRMDCSNRFSLPKGLRRSHF